MSNLFGILPVCPSKRILLLCLSYVILLVSCTKNDIIYEKIVDTPSDQEVTDNDISRIKINFNANINQLTEFVSSSSTELAENRYASIFAYKRGGNLIQEETYYSKSQGTLTPTSESLFLTSGDTYSLYAAGVNDVNVAVPSFVDGKASDLAQNMDYIWWASYGYSPTSTNADVAVDFNHCCTQIVLRISAVAPLEIYQFKGLEITPSTLDGIYWDLFNNGNIGPSSSLQTQMDAVNFTNDSGTKVGTYIMAPIKVSETTYITSQFVVYFSADESRAFTYQAKIPVYNNEMKAGTSYTYNLSINPNAVILGDITIGDWIVVDEKGNPIIPEQNE